MKNETGDEQVSCRDDKMVNATSKCFNSPKKLILQGFRLGILLDGTDYLGKGTRPRILSLKLIDGQNAEVLGLKGDEVYVIEGSSNTVKPQTVVNVQATRPDGSSFEFKATVLLNTGV